MGVSFRRQGERPDVSLIALNSENGTALVCARERPAMVEELLAASGKHAEL